MLKIGSYKENKTNPFFVCSVVWQQNAFACVCVIVTYRHNGSVVQHTTGPWQSLLAFGIAGWSRCVVHSWRLCRLGVFLSQDVEGVLSAHCRPSVPRWWCGSVVKHRYLTAKLSLSLLNLWLTGQL